MTVLQEDPFATLQRCFDHLLCYWPLSLTQWDGLNPETHREKELVKLSQAKLHCFGSWFYNSPSASLQQTAKLSSLPVETTSLFRKTLEGTHGIGACAENEDQWGGGGHVVIEISQVNWRVFHKLLPQVDNHELCCCKDHLDEIERRSIID